MAKNPATCCCEVVAPPGTGTGGPITNECCPPLPRQFNLSVTGSVGTAGTGSGTGTGSAVNCMNFDITLTYDAGFVVDCSRFELNTYWVGTSHGGCITWVLECGTTAEQPAGSGEWALWHIDTASGKCDDVNLANPSFVASGSGTVLSCSPFYQKFINNAPLGEFDACGCPLGTSQNYTAIVTEV